MIAYILVAACYTAVGVAGVLAFGVGVCLCVSVCVHMCVCVRVQHDSHSRFVCVSDYEELPQIILDVFDLNNIPAFINRCVIFFQVYTHTHTCTLFFSSLTRLDFLIFN